MTWDSVPTSPAVRQVAQAVLAFTLESGSPLQWPISEPLASADWIELTNLAHRERILGPMQAAIEGNLPVTADQATDAANQHRNAMSTAAVLESILPACLEPFRNAGIEVLVVKGLATAHTVYTYPELRQFGDIDILVSPTDFTEVIKLIRRHWEFHTPPIGPTAAAVQKGVTATIDGGFQLDVHQSIAWGPPWLSATDDLFAHAREASIGATRARVLEPAGLLLHAAVTLAQPQSRLSTVLDIAHLLHQATFDATRFGELVAQTDASLIVEQAFDRTQSWIPEVELVRPGWSTGTARSRQRASLQSFLMPRKRLAMLLSAGRVGRGQRVQLLRDLALPSSEWLESSPWHSRLDHLRRLPGHLVFGED